MILFILTGCSSEAQFSDEEQYINLVESKLVNNLNNDFDKSMLESIENPIGIGKFVYVNFDKTYSDSNIHIGWVIENDNVYPLNERSKDLTLNSTYLYDADERQWDKTNIDELSSPQVETLFNKIIMVSYERREKFSYDFLNDLAKKQKENKNNTSSSNSEEISNIDYITIKINSETSWRGVYGNNNGLEKISGEGNKEIKVKDIEPIIATIQHTGVENKKVEVKIEKDNEVKEQKTLSSRYRSYMLAHYVDNGDFNNSNVPEGKLAPLGNEDGDSLDNFADPLPNYYGEVTKSEYKYLLDKWSKQTIKIIEEIIYLNNRYQMGEITQNKYINKLNNMSQFKSDKHFKVVLDDINSIVGPKKYMRDEYFWMAISDLDYVFYERFDPENYYGSSYKIKEDLEEIISFLDNVYRISNVESVDKLIDKVIHLQNVL